MKTFTCCLRRQKEFEPALPSVPGEVLRDFLLPPDRWTLYDVQFTCRRFLRLSTERMSDVCLRNIYYAAFNASDKYYIDSPKGASFFIHVDGGEREQRISKAHKDIARLFSQFVQALRSSLVHFLDFNGKYTK